MKKYKIYTAIASLLVLICLVALRVKDPFFVETARLKTLDYYQITQEKVKSESVVVVEIDEKTLEKHGQWPFPRQILANAITKAFDNGAEIVVLPIIFAESDRFNGDAALKETFGKYPVIISQSAANKGKGSPVPRGVSVIGGGIDEWLFDYPAAIGPTKELGEAAAGVGMLLTAPEVDGVVRRLPLIVQINKELYPTLPLEILRVVSNDPSYQAKVNQAGVTAIRIPKFKTIKTDENGRVWLNFKYTFDSFSFTKEDWSEVKGKIVMIAPTAEGLSNTVATSVNIKNGYEIPLFAAQMLLDDSRLERPSEFNTYEILYGLVAALVVIVAFIWLNYLVCAGLSIVLMIAPVVYGAKAFSNGLLFDYSWIVAALFICFSVSAFMRFINEFKQKQQIRKQFEHYLAPAMVKKLQSNPELLKLGGETKDLTILFSDVRGFTALSEHFKTDPQGLTSLINRYMTPMLKLVMSKDGTVDKLIGDAVMAFWNAPVNVARHKELAIECAVEMFTKLDELNKQLALEKLPQLSIGVGVNSGSVVVGNMGSENRFDYTCLGDAVNLSSRLEGQSKPYHVEIVIGEQTVKGIENSFNFLELDNIAVKGKKEGVKIYTVITNDEKANKIVSHHKKMMDFYYEMNWQEAEIYLARLKAENSKMIKYYEMMESRIFELKTANLPKDWDGVYHATSK